MTSQPDLFAQRRDRRSGFVERVEAFIAPVASDAGAVTRDPTALQLAEAVYEAFGDLDSENGLTRAELNAACSGVASQTAFDTRIDLFIRLGLLQPVRAKPHQGRYVFNPTSAAALLVFERLTEVGGVQEIMALLDRTRQGLRSGVVGRDQVEQSLVRARRALSIYSNHLLRLVRSSPFEELLAERSHHRSTEGLVADARDIVGLVAKDFPELAAAGTRLIGEALRYSAAVSEFIDRVLDQAGSRQDFSLLHPEQYLTAALTGTIEQLAVVFENTLFDPAAVSLTPSQLVAAVEQYRPPPARRRPPRPAATPLVGPHPVDQARQRAQAARQRRVAVIELLLRGTGEMNLTEALLETTWARAARIVIDVLIASSDASVPFSVRLSQCLLAVSDGPVTYVTPMYLHRDSADTPGLRGDSVGE